MLVCLRASFPEEKISKERKNIIKLTPKKREEMDNQKQKDVTGAVTAFELVYKKGLSKFYDNATIELAP